MMQLTLDGEYSLLHGSSAYSSYSDVVSRQWYVIFWAAITSCDEVPRVSISAPDR